MVAEVAAGEEEAVAEAEEVEAEEAEEVEAEEVEAEEAEADPGPRRSSGSPSHRPSRRHSRP